MKIENKFTNGGQIPAHGNEKTNEQLISELSNRNRRFRQVINLFASLNENAPEFKTIAAWIKDAREVLK
jgi:hypothetical protein